MALYEVVKKYHFYAAHRNEKIEGKCKNIHGHTYFLTLSFSLNQNKNGITVLFSEIDSLISPILEELDHSFLLNKNDPKRADIEKVAGKVKLIEGVTSAENLARNIFYSVKNLTALNVIYVEIQETTSSIVRFSGS